MKTMNKAGQSEALFIVKAFEKGWEIAKPFHHAQSYDFLIKRNGKWQTVQVKTAHRDSERNQIKIRLRRNKRQYQEGDFDLLAVVYEGHMWLIDWENIKHAKWTLMIDGLAAKHKYDRFII